MSDRIKLAEARGWTKSRQPDWWIPPGYKWGDGLSAPTHKLPDPENDANDDYAVLEWARKEWRDKATNKKKYGPGFSFKWYTFRERLGSNTMYQIGDYARAALKVIG